jgi:hypothetical protein
MLDDPIDGAWTLLTSPTGVLALIACGECLLLAIVCRLAKKGKRVIGVVGMIGIVAGVLCNIDFHWPEFAADPESAAINASFGEARKRPLYDIEGPGTEPDKFTITRCEVRRDYLIETVYGCYITRRFWGFKSRTITVLDKNRHRVGSIDRTTYSYLERHYDSNIDETGHLRTQELLDDLANGTVTLALHDFAVDRHLESIATHIKKQQARAAAYVKKANYGE